MNKCNKGSILLEAVAAMAITMIIVITSYKICIISKKNIINQKEIFDERQTLNAVANEVKYNISFYEFKNVLKDGSISIKYDDNFLKDLTSKSLLDFENASKYERRIEIVKLSEEDEELRIKIQLVNNDENLKIEVVKGYWMDYV